METKIAEPVQDGCEPKSVNDIVSEVLAQKTKKNKFLQNVGIALMVLVLHASASYKQN